MGARVDVGVVGGREAVEREEVLGQVRVVRLAGDVVPAVVPDYVGVDVPRGGVEGVLWEEGIGRRVSFDGKKGSARTKEEGIRILTTTSFFPMKCNVGVLGLPSLNPLKPHPFAGPNAATKTAHLTGLGGHSTAVAERELGGAAQRGWRCGFSRRERRIPAAAAPWEKPKMAVRCEKRGGRDQCVSSSHRESEGGSSLATLFSVDDDGNGEDERSKIRTVKRPLPLPELPERPHHLLQVALFERAMVEPVPPPPSAFARAAGVDSGRSVGLGAGSGREGGVGEGWDAEDVRLERSEGGQVKRGSKRQRCRKKSKGRDDGDDEGDQGRNRGKLSTGAREGEGRKQKRTHRLHRDQLDLVPPDRLRRLQLPLEHIAVLSVSRKPEDADGHA